MIEFAAGGAHVVVDPVRGGRIARFDLNGFEVLVTRAAAIKAGHQTDEHGELDPMAWGSYPMVPWAGRVRRGRFGFQGSTFELDINMAPHAIHGTGYRSVWEPDGPETIATRLEGGGWPFGGFALQRFYLTEHQLVCTLEVHADRQSMPAHLGWHPWFTKPRSLGFEAASMYLRDDDGISTDVLTPPPPGPWDDCFTGVREPVTLNWEQASLAITSTCDHWVVYDMPRHATCVEPQSGPPDAFTLAPHVVEPGDPLIKTMTWRW